jgi:hypothetical protein
MTGRVGVGPDGCVNIRATVLDHRPFLVQTCGLPSPPGPGSVVPGRVARPA